MDPLYRHNCNNSCLSGRQWCPDGSWVPLTPQCKNNYFSLNHHTKVFRLIIFCPIIRKSYDGSPYGRASKGWDNSCSPQLPHLEFSKNLNNWQLPVTCYRELAKSCINKTLSSHFHNSELSRESLSKSLESSSAYPLCFTCLRDPVLANEKHWSQV